MACKKNEVAILKASAVRLDKDTMMLLTYMYHTAEKEARRNGEDKSFYRYEGRVVKIEDFKKEIEDLESDTNAMGTWTWPTKISDWNKDWYLAYYGDKTNKMAAKWYKLKLSKMILWDDFINLAKNGVKNTAKGVKTYPSARYDLDEYETEDGVKFNIDSPATMIGLVGKFFSKKVIMKREIA